MENGRWLREQYVCVRCGSITRWRAVMLVLERVLPDWRRRAIYECSPGGAGSQKLAKECAGYVGSQYHQGAAGGTMVEGYRCEDLEQVTFESGSFDAVVTQDVFEHIPHPELAFAEVARVLRPGGVHVFTVPFRPHIASARRVIVSEGGRLVHVLPAQYHGNPVDPGGSLVITDWGADLPDFIRRHSGMVTTIHRWQDRWQGIAGEVEVFESRKD